MKMPALTGWRSILRVCDREMTVGLGRRKHSVRGSEMTPEKR
jgi:hypothetical protein